MGTERILCFDSPGKENTEETMKASLERAKVLGIKDVVVASTTGATGIRACGAFKGFDVVVVTHHVGFREPGVSQVSKQNEDKIRSLGGKTFTGMHALRSRTSNKDEVKHG